MLTVCTVLLLAAVIWNFVMLILVFAARKNEKYERAKSRFIVSSVFLIAAIFLFAAALIVTEIFIEPIFHM